MILQQFMLRYNSPRERGEREKEAILRLSRQDADSKKRQDRARGRLSGCRCRPGAAPIQAHKQTTMTDLWEPTLTQQRALAYAPKPLAFISLISSSIVIYHLGCRRKQKLRRMYHRLILAMSMVDLPFAVSWIWGNWVRV